MKYTKKALALFLALCMMVTSLPLSANATEAVQQVAAAAEDVVASSEEAVESEDGIVSETEDTESEEAEVVVDETQQQETTTDENVDSDINETEDAVENTEEAENADAVVVENESATETAEDKEVQEEVEAVAEPEVGSNDEIMLTSELDEGIATYAASNSTDTVYVLAGGDFQEKGDHANSAENVTNILAQIDDNYSTMNGFLFIGDYDCETHNDATETANGITALMGAVQGTYSNLDAENSVLVQGNHDYMDSRIDATGGHDFDGYSAYVLNEDDYPNGGGSQSGVQTLANNLKTWLNNKIGEGYNEPIFIVSHLPLAFTPRTVTQDDAKYAKYIFDVLNDAGENGLNIIFMHGHDHAYGPDNYMGGEAIYLAEGDKICIAEAGSTSAWTEETLNFTYMNAGYTGYYSDPFTYDSTAGTDKLTMTVFAITGSEVTVERYSANGLYNLKSEGYDGSYSDTSKSATSLGLTLNSTVYASPQTIELAEAETYGTIGSYVGVTDETPADDVATSGNSWVEITAPVPGTEATPGSTTYQYTLDTDGVNRDSAYLIVGSGSDDKALGNGTLTAVDTTISDSTAIMDNQDYEWKINSSNQVYRTVGNTTYYLKFTGTYQNYQASGSVSVVTNASEATSWNIFHEGNGAYAISYTYSYGSWITRETTYYLRYNSNSFSVSSSSNTVRLYGDVQEITIPETGATPDTNGRYGKVVGDLSYTVANGTTADDALAEVKAGLDGYYYEAMSTPGSDVAGTIVDDSVLRWTLDSSYNGNVPGDYAVTISYGEVPLGTAEVIVPAATTYYVAEGNGLYLVDMNTSEDDALAAVKAGVTVYSATDANGTNKKAVSDDDVTWNWVDTYNGADSGPYTVEILYNGTSLGTVEVKVNVKYETGITEGWTSVGTQAGGYKYVLDTDGIEYGESNKYIIVAANQALALHATSTANGTAQSITIDGTTATTTTRDYEYHFIETAYDGTRYELITKGDGSSYLYQQDSGVRYGTRSSVKFQINHHGSGVYDIHDIDGTNWYLIYNGSWTVVEDTSARVRLYKYDGEIVGGDIYAKIEGNTVYTVDQGTSATQALAEVKAGITGYISSNADGSEATELADNELTWKWKNTYTGMYTGSYWVEISYNGVVLGTVEVKVEPGVINNYPEYPDEGAVKVHKTATGIDFQSSGIAQVELSASGVPIKKGTDVIIMLDTSSSMAYCLDCNDTRHSSYECDQGGQTRAQALEESLGNLITQFKTPGDDGQLLDIDVAIADFNGFYGDDHNESGTPYDRDAADMMSDDISYTANSQAQIYTGDNTLGAGAFIAAEDLAASYTLNYTSGTNYDYAMDAIYQMATAKKIANGSEDRDLYVLFMSDGAAMQWNGYHSQGNSSLWNNWITGTWDSNDLTTANLNCTTHAYYYDEVDHDGDGQINEHRMANAIKGNPNETYEVIRKTNDLGTATDEDNMYMVSGLGAKMFSIAFDPRVDTNVTVESLVKSVASIASDQTGTTQYFYNVSSADELANAFTVIGDEIAYAASNARFVDQMGDGFNLQIKTSTYEVVDGNTTTTKTLAPVIEIISYDIYTRQYYLNGTITEDKIGDRKGTSTLNEVVKFSDDGTKAYSNLIDVDGDGVYGVTVNSDGTYTISDTDDDILGDNDVIYAKTFLYNTGVTDITIDGVDIPTGTKADGTTTVLPSETFYWKLGTVTTTELAMRYYVYLDGSLEGTKEAGSYSTNEYAVLYYDNYLGNPCHKDTTSPVMAWKSANVSYAFYLVDENGNIIVNQTTGATGSFAHKIAVTNPVVYEEILLNNTDQVQSIDVKAISDDVLPKYYDLYDESAVYEVTINSNSTGSWTITKGEGLVESTYITQYKTEDASAYSNALSNNTIGDDYTHTVVWFAVVWKVQAHPDTVVIDYGLPVDISVLTNDMFGEYGKLAGVGAYSDGLESTTAGPNIQTGFSGTYTGTYGTAKTDTATGKVRYTLNSSNGMQMQAYEKFAYAVNYSGEENAGYYYDTVTVIPATTIYYEDSFLTYAASNTEWVDEGTTIENATQEEDRPGAYSLTDANNIYGYDAVNLGMSTFSLGTAKKVHVDSDSYATASFTFYGTGFDVIGMTSNTTGTIAIKVTAAENIVVGGETVYASGEKVKATMVDTYYGYTSENHEILYTYTNGAWVAKDKGKSTDTTVTTKIPDSPIEGSTYTAIEQVWVATPDTAKALYQVPVMQIEELPYGKYNVVITATYAEALDNTTADGYDLYLDAIRIYDPANDGAADGTTDITIENAYKADGEGWPSYIELRDKIIAAESFDDVSNEALATDMEGLVFIDGDSSVGDAQISDYVSYGPNNEIYLAPGQRVAFMLSDVTRTSTDTAGNSITESIVESIHIGIKSADGITGTYTITNIAQVADDENNVDAGDYYGARTYTINTATDMYYDLTGWRNDIIVISNTGDRYGTTGIISLTNIKSTYTADPNGENVVSTASADDAYGVSVASVEGEEISNNETYMYMTPAAATLTLRSVNTPIEEETPDEVVPEEPDSDITEPEEPQPEEPEEDTTESEDDIVDEIITEVTNMIVETINTIKNVFNWLFGWKGAN